MVIKSTNATTETSDVSTMESLDVLPPKAKIPISGLFSFCTPKKQPLEEESEDTETDEITGRSLTFTPEILPLKEDDVIVEEVEKGEEGKEAGLFDKGLLLQMGVVGVLLAVDKLI